MKGSRVDARRNRSLAFCDRVWKPELSQHECPNKRYNVGTEIRKRRDKSYIESCGTVCYWYGDSMECNTKRYIGGSKPVLSRKEG